jgi:hypothetical protein
MAAYIWNANPAKWNIVPPASDSWESLKAYVTDPSKFVYWSTPALQAHILVGDAAFIWRTQYKGHANGIIALGYVEERPQDLSLSSSHFLHSGRLMAAGWNEAAAPSSWKTGIRLCATFWDSPLQAPTKPSQGTVRTLTDDEVQLIGQALP